MLAGRLLAAALDALEAARADGGGSRPVIVEGGGKPTVGDATRGPLTGRLCVVEHTFPSVTDDHVGFLELRWQCLQCSVRWVGGTAPIEAIVNEFEPWVHELLAEVVPGALAENLRVPLWDHSAVHEPIR